VIRDIIRAALAVLVMSIAAGIVIELRLSLAAIDVAHRAAIGGQSVHYQPQQTEPPGRLQQFGRASIQLADAAIRLVR
jgi:hypothetical protein